MPVRGDITHSVSHTRTHTFHLVLAYLLRSFHFPFAPVCVDSSNENVCTSPRDTYTFPSFHFTSFSRISYLLLLLFIFITHPCYAFSVHILFLMCRFIRRGPVCVCACLPVWFFQPRTTLTQVRMRIFCQPDDF